MFDEELSQTVWIVHTLLQLCQEITVWHKAEVRQERSNKDVKQTAQRGCGTRWTITNTVSSWSIQDQSSLFVPVVDLVDVSKHNPVLPSHVLWNALTGHRGHVALYEQKDASPVSHWMSKCESFVSWSYLNDEPKILNVQPLCLDQLCQNISEEEQDRQDAFGQINYIWPGVVYRESCLDGMLCSAVMSDSCLFSAIHVSRRSAHSGGGAMTLRFCEFLLSND